MKVSIEVSRIDARRLRAILAGNKKGYRETLVYLEKIKETNPDWRLGPNKQTPEEVIKTTQKSIETIDRVLEQLREDREQ